MDGFKTLGRRLLQRRIGLGTVLAVAFFLSSPPAHAQPWGAWMLTGSSATGDYIQVPHSPALNPVSQITIEGWVSVSDGGGCSSIVGKGFQSAWWVGLCGTTLRSYLKGGASAHDGGSLSSGWHHFAVTYDGVRRRHYVDGEEVGSWAESGPLTTNTAAMRIGSDVNWSPTPNGAIDQIRIWSVARTRSQLRETINQQISSPMPGLQAVYELNGATDELGSHSGSIVGSPGFLTFPVATGCETTDTSLCLDGRLAVTVGWRTRTGTEGVGTVVPCFAEDSGNFWFFNPNNWELLVKTVDGCANNGHRWVFSAATTNVHYRLTVTDVVAGAQKIYFNYQGVSAPAVTDTQALATCP
ncbi:MAG: LamG domain-containing protein [Acidobacteria bacterium]|nr:LamG domain-containing protein [Acidobacteriota bacterium]